MPLLNNAFSTKLIAYKHADAELGALLSASHFQHRHHLAIAARFGQRERCVALPIGQLRIGFGVDQRLQRGLMARAAVAEHDGFDDGRPPGAPPTPTTPITSLPTLIGTPLRSTLSQTTQTGRRRARQRK